MKMKPRIIIIFVLAILSLCSLSWYFQRYWITPVYSMIELTKAKQDILRCTNVLDLEVNKMESLVSELASLKPAGQIQKDEKRALDALQNLIDLKIIDFFFLVGSDGKVAAKASFSGTFKNESDEALITGQAFKFMQSQAGKAARTVNAGLLNTPDGIVLMASKPLDMVSNGYVLVAGKILTSKIITNMGKQIRIPFTLQYCNNPGDYLSSLNISLASAQDIRAVYIQDFGNNDFQLICCSTFPDITRKLNFVVTAQIPRIVFLEANSSLNLLLFAQTLFGVLLLILVTIIVHIFVISPIIRLKKSIARVREEKSLSKRVRFETRKDEIGDLSIEFDNLLDQIQTLIESMEETISRKTAEVRFVRDDIIRRLSVAVDNKDHGLSGHSTRVSGMAFLLADKLGIVKSKCELISLASILHDIGKIGLPDYLLVKDSKYTDEEYSAMKAHALIGGNIFAGSDSELMVIAHNIALYHHERYDGKGYPSGLKGTDIPIEARITAVVDIFDSLLTDKKYRNSWSEDDVIKYMKDNSDVLFDPEIIKVLMANVNECLDIRKLNPDKM